MKLDKDTSSDVIYARCVKNKETKNYEFHDVVLADNIDAMTTATPSLWP